MPESFWQIYKKRLIGYDLTLPVTTPRLELVKKAGIEYAENSFIPAELLGEIEAPMIPEEEYARIINR